MDHRLGFLNQCGQIWLWYCKAYRILEEMHFFCLFSTFPMSHFHLLHEFFKNECGRRLP